MNRVTLFQALLILSLCARPCDVALVCHYWEGSRMKASSEEEKLRASNEKNSILCSGNGATARERELDGGRAAPTEGSIDLTES